MKDAQQDAMTKPPLNRLFVMSPAEGASRETTCLRQKRIAVFPSTGFAS
jgi:hypothetical protein